MNFLDDESEEWSNEHFGRLALYRTIASVINIFLTLVVIAKLFEVI